MKKYEFTGLQKREWIDGKFVTLNQIRATKDFGDVKNGQIGGFIEKEKNLSQNGLSWVGKKSVVYGDAQVYGDAWVYGDARVYGNAWVYGDARVYGNALISKIEDLFIIGLIGSRNDFVTFYKNKNNGISVKCGCFSGNIEEFLEKVKQTHGDTKHGRTYKLAAELAKLQILEEEGDEQSGI